MFVLHCHVRSTKGEELLHTQRHFTTQTQAYESLERKLLAWEHAGASPVVTGLRAELTHPEYLETFTYEIKEEV